MPRKIYDWSVIQRYHDEGHGFVECQKRFRFSHTAWVKAVKRGELNAGPRDFVDRRRRYDWAEIQAYYDEGHTYRECALEFGFCAASWHKAVKRGEIRPTYARLTVTQLFSKQRYRNVVRRVLLREGVLENRCSICGITMWRDKPLSMHLDHINGVASDHRIENLRMLCPNCHSQTDTYAGRNRKKRRGDCKNRGQACSITPAAFPDDETVS